MTLVFTRTFCKNWLRKRVILCQFIIRNNLVKLMYQTFVSTVEIEGEFFTGQDAKTRKQAEISAAKVAYIRLKERNLSHIPEFVSPANQAQANYSSSSVQSTVADQHHHVQPTCRMVFSPSLIPREPAEESRVNSKVSCSDILAQFPQPEIIPWKEDSSTLNISVVSRPENGPTSSSLPPDCTVTSIKDSRIEQPVGTDTFNCNRIRVYPYYSKHEISRGKLSAAQRQ